MDFSLARRQDDFLPKTFAKTNFFIQVKIVDFEQQYSTLNLCTRKEKTRHLSTSSPELNPIELVFHILAMRIWSFWYRTAGPCEMPSSTRQHKWWMICTIHWFSVAVHTMATNQVAKTRLVVSLIGILLLFLVYKYLSLQTSTTAFLACSLVYLHITMVWERAMLQSLGRLGLPTVSLLVS